MIDRERIARIRSHATTWRLEPDRSDDDEERLADIEWLLERAEQLADDNARLARLVAEITEIVAGAQARGGVADVIDLALVRAGQKPGA